MFLGQFAESRSQVKQYKQTSP